MSNRPDSWTHTLLAWYVKSKPRCAFFVHTNMSVCVLCFNTLSPSHTDSYMHTHTQQSCLYGVTFSFSVLLSTARSELSPDVNHRRQTGAINLPCDLSSKSNIKIVTIKYTQHVLYDESKKMFWGLWGRTERKKNTCAHIWPHGGLCCRGACGSGHWWTSGCLFHSCWPECSWCVRSKTELFRTQTEIVSSMPADNKYIKSHETEAENRTENGASRRTGGRNKPVKEGGQQPPQQHLVSGPCAHVTVH